MSPYRIQTDDGTVSAERVTEIIRRGMPMPFLERWKVREAVAYAVKNPPMGTTDEAITSTVAAWEQDSRRHAQRGTKVHELIAAFLRDPDILADMEYDNATLGKYFDAAIDYLRGPFRSFCGDDLFVEQTLLDKTMTVAGTADLISGGVLVDWKSVGNKKDADGPLWPDQKAQAGAYSSMAHLVTDKTIAGPAPTIREARIVRLSPDGSWCEHILAGEDLAEARALWRHVREVARHVRGLG